MRNRLLIYAACSALLLFSYDSTAAHSSKADKSMTNLEYLIDLAERGEVEAAKKIALTTAKLDTGKIDDRILLRIGALLESPDTGIHFWAAGAVGHFGSRAMVFVPRLETIVSEEACNKEPHSGVDRGDTALAALTKIGVPKKDYECSQF